MKTLKEIASLQDKLVEFDDLFTKEAIATLKTDGAVTKLIIFPSDGFAELLSYANDAKPSDRPKVCLDIDELRWLRDRLIELDLG